ncbi:ribonuclease HII [Bacillus sp. 7504-2]|nr:ribonuclease HII [Bacillus sp. 7504-2]
MTIYTIKEIEEKLAKINDENDPFLEEIKPDARKGVQRLLEKYGRQLQQKKQALEKFSHMSRIERNLYKQGYKLITGIDEVGRGPLAGPVVASSVILPEDFQLLGLDDSKKLTEAKREEFYAYIQEHALAVGVGIIQPEEIDQVNIYEATKKAMLSAIAAMPFAPEYLLIDAMKLDTPYPSQAIIKGDANSISIAAASIIAKVTRDAIMKQLHSEYPFYQFERNMGYGTKEHLVALEKHGMTPYHRKSFEPIKSMMK